ncbi:rod shape-determining protein MreC [Aquabacterium parvum]|uniref:rod shape-determining protein MreC n=1 Tax=Aquabacterium parvum TaxID=70584 RepID=UPI0009F8993A|nr:rod shape-determining protein MreC [Aquabacterium parvum]MBU0917996.1 rod shape-determining protein MreC [Gammaproteobacteria bacterium]
MPLATLDRSPPPFFKQGPSAFTRLTFFSALAVLLMVADARWKMTQPLRAAVATVLHPVQQGLLAPSRAWDTMAHYFAGLDEARAMQARAERQITAQAERVMRVDDLLRENARLRALLELRPRLDVPSTSAEILYATQDPYTRKVVIDRGGAHGVGLGSPVIDPAGVIGQVTRVYPLTSEVTLVIDQDAAVPVVNVRTEQRGVAYGLPQSRGMELRFMAGNADVQVGDRLETSGLDGVYPPGLPVAQVARIDRRADSAFARIVLTPLSNPESSRYVLLLQTTGHGLEGPAQATVPGGPAAAVDAPSVASAANVAAASAAAAAARAHARVAGHAASHPASAAQAVVGRGAASPGASQGASGAASASKPGGRP